MSTTTLPPLARTLLAPLHWLERARGRWRLALIALYLVVGAAVGSLAWRAVSLARLPDVGDPFDVGAYKASLHVPDDRNAFVLYGEAIGKLKKATPAENRVLNLVLSVPGRPATGPSIQPVGGPAKGAASPTGWAAANPTLLAWMDANREALAIWRRGTERPDALTEEPSGLNWMEVYPLYSDFTPLALLEAMRLEARGQMAEAWGWYRAALRSSRHAGMHGSSQERRWGHLIYQRTADQITRWAADPRVDPGLLRRALDETIALDTLTAPASEMLKAEYLGDMRELDFSEARLFAQEPQLFGDEHKLWYFHLPLVARGRQFYMREPERSRRVLRLIYANLLAYADAPPSRQPPAVLPGVFDLAAHPEAPANARLLSPEQLASWLNSTLLAQHMTFGRRQLGMIAGEALTRDNLILGLARELYRREHGQAPPNDRALVGPYLKTLPETGLDPASPAPPNP